MYSHCGNPQYSIWVSFRCLYCGNVFFTVTANKSKKKSSFTFVSFQINRFFKERKQNIFVEYFMEHFWFIHFTCTES